MAKATAVLKYLHMAPRKVRLIASTLRGLRVNDAQAQLMFRRQRAAQPLFKLLKSAIHNAKNLKLDETALVVKDIRVDGGPMLKRLSPRAMGRGTVVQKKMSHVIIVLEDSFASRAARYVIPEQKKKEKKTKKPKVSKTTAGRDGASPETTREEDKKDGLKYEEKSLKKTKGLGSFAKKFFQRKSV